MNKLFVTLLFIVFFVTPFIAKSQHYYDETLGQDRLNAITTSVPFLMIAPDSRSGAMGDVGVATRPDGYAQHWNSSKLAFIDQPMGATISYTPWLKKLVNDINLAYVTGYYKLDENQTIGAGLRYFSMGSITFTNDGGDVIGNFSPHEFALDGSYNRKLSDNFSMGVVGRFILSDLTGGTGVSGAEQTSAGTSVAVDVNGFYTQPMEVSGYKGNWAAGFNISNIGAKLGYTENEKNFIPTNLRLGASGTLDLDEYNSISVAVDLNKLLVPTPPVYYVAGDTLPDGSIFIAGNTPIIRAGMDNNVAIAQGMLQSFYDAPGGFKEEMREITYSIGFEYWYAKQFAVRGGYFYENQYKGNRKYFTAGIGLKMNVFGLDFSYLIPAGNFNNSPLSNTWRFSLIFDFEAFNNQ